MRFDTERLTLRRHRIEDFANSFAMWSDLGVARYISGQPSTEQQAWSRLLTYVGHWELMGFGYWVVEERLTGSFVGEVGFAEFKRAIEPSIRDAPEAGWVLTPSMHAKGYATEAVRAALHWSDTHLSAKRTVCIIDPENAPSLRVAQRLDFREIAVTTYNGKPTLMFERTPPES